MITRINNIPTDENNNTWPSSITDEQAAIFSTSLITCSHCSNCSYCSNCTSCLHCSDCSCCSDCSDCFGCSDCFACSGCSGCFYCSDCFGCSYCSDCSDFKTNPARLTSLPMGSRNDQTNVYWTKTKTLVVCECFTGPLELFEEAVNKTHANNPHHLTKYQAFISIAKQAIALK